MGGIRWLCDGGHLSRFENPTRVPAERPSLRQDAEDVTLEAYASGHGAGSSRFGRSSLLLPHAVSALVMIGVVQLFDGSSTLL